MVGIFINNMTNSLVLTLKEIRKQKHLDGWPRKANMLRFAIMILGLLFYSGIHGIFLIEQLVIRFVLQLM